MSDFTNVYFGKDSNGSWVLGDDIEDVVTPGDYKKTYAVVDTVVHIGVMNQSRGEFEQTPRPVTNYLDLTGTAYADYAAFKKATEEFFGINVGVADDEYDAVLSDTVDLAHPGWIQPLLLAGTIKYTTARGSVRTRAFDLKEVSPFRVKRVWSNGTTADMGIVVIY